MVLPRGTVIPARSLFRLIMVEELPKHLYTFHGCGLGNHFDARQHALFWRSA